MIPEQTLEALTNGIGHLGSASADRKPTHTDTLSASVDQANDTVTCFTLSLMSGAVFENFQATGRVSYFFGLPSHEAYQFKGQFLETRELTEDELAHSEQIRNSLQEMMVSMGIPPEAAALLFGTAPDLGITFKVEKIFKQTPGPEAGQELPFN
jgi:hypothetical protein